MKTEELQVADEIDALAKSTNQEIADIRAKKGASTYVSDLMPALLALATNYAATPADLKKADDIAFFVKELYGAVFPQNG